ncbi:MAG: hypothetical protein HKM04_09815 [Legionellales bacterium]|nr:hypothetical protein [Legionellales bacterium]
MSFNSMVDFYIQSYVPTKFGSINATHYIAIVVNILLIMIFSYLIGRLNLKAELRTLSMARDAFKGLNLDEKEAEEIDILDKKMIEIAASDQKSRKALLHEFVEIKKKLDTMRRNLAFLSIDVVDSTGMKENEDNMIIANDFAEYRIFVEGNLNTFRCIKSTWTPDGVMSCFETKEDAFNAAKAIMEGLPEFNRTVITMKRAFVVRCGINAGILLFDDQLPLEEISDHVIDIAGHMQKYAEPNSIFLARELADTFDSPQLFKPVEKIVDNLAVSKWSQSD